MSRITAVFQNQQDAQAALQELHQLGVSDQHTYYSHRQQASGETLRPDPDGTINTDTGDADRPSFLLPPVINAAVPVGIGGLGSPGAGAVLAAAALEEQPAGTHNPVVTAADPEKESHFYNDALRGGKLLISVDAADSLQEEQVRDALARHHGAFYTH
ncbi:hypothetical protein [Deinococcus roseus]|uniref:General stress protein 17M-like domain-containing protein n=1 Tax=Deinococcus roseus TaxID=392414 RepID=A0ABQ2DDV2_9DEIO|nr:hypothetical protein [Deinococcus roseus]GGJ52218.1 hypothetical protein GCM10008938_42800 [Deinococcus roseus]